ncbi:hypothetical protein LV84_03170 [Algoriphagus ratkowskyi]|uniref:Uncharacterized protein n=1 Tax=Algoriphagus ratkowskyi TaxID=57028 RepID=A0A2W7R2L2_9BACT|nr:hypothetical protein LV84_03170 [Algoriphagus ratkowskyi]
MTFEVFRTSKVLYSALLLATKVTKFGKVGCPASPEAGLLFDC